MTVITTTNGRPSTTRQAAGALLPFLAGGLLGIMATLGLTSDDPAPAAPAPTTAAAAPSAVVASPEAVEHWALAAPHHAVTACAATQQAPDAIERCVARRAGA